MFDAKHQTVLSAIGHAKHGKVVPWGGEYMMPVMNEMPVYAVVDHNIDGLALLCSCAICNYMLLPPVLQLLLSIQGYTIAEMCFSYGGP